jgi:hypothetical protein
MSAAIDSMQNYHCNIALTELIAVFLGIAGIGALMQQILSFKSTPLEEERCFVRAGFTWSCEVKK